MTEERDFDRLARAWLELGPDEAPDRVVAAVLRAAETTPQVRRPFGSSIWRSFAINRVAQAFGAVAVLGILVIGGALFLNQRNQPTIGGPAMSASPTPRPSLEVSPSPAPPSTAGIVLQRAPANLGCDAMDPGYRSATIHIDPDSDIYLEIANPSWDGTTVRVNVDVWAEVDALPSGSTDTEPVEPLPVGTRLAVYWTAGFNATDGNTPVIRGPRGEEVARDGTRIDQAFIKRTGYFTCASRDALYVLEYAPG